MLHLIGGALYLALMIRLWREGLQTRYPAFFAWLGLQALSSVALRGVSFQSNLYAEIYMVTSALSWLMLYFVLRELCRLLFADHPGIAAAVRIGIWVSFGAAVCAAAGLLVFFPDNSAQGFPLLQAFFSLYKAVMLFLSILFVGTILFVAWFPVALRRNTIAYCLGFSLTFLMEGGTMLARNFPYFADYAPSLGLINQGFAISILLIWLVMLDRAGEQAIMAVGHRWNVDESAQVLDSLNGLNETLAKALRRPPR